MQNISYYSRDAIDERQNIAHWVDKYERHTEYGVTRIYFHVDITKKWAVLCGLTIVPGLVYIGDDALNDGQLCTGEGTHYFDAHSGEQISYCTAQENKGKNRKAHDLNNEGQELRKRGQHKEAYGKFRDAYITCTSGYKDESMFKKNRDNAMNDAADALNAEGASLSRAGKHKEAYEKYKEAYETCTSDYKDKDLFRSNRDIAEGKMQKNLEADHFNEKGKRLYENKQYREAYKEFKKAYETCASGYTEESTFKSNRDMAKNRLADTLNSEAKSLSQVGKHKEAYEKYKEAYETCTSDYKDEGLFRSNRDIAEGKMKKNVEADRLNQEGMMLYVRQRYREAYEKFKESYETCASGYTEESTFKYNRDMAKNNFADALNSEGNVLSHAGRHEEAYEKYKEAYNMCTSDYKNVSRFRSNRDAEKIKRNNNREADRLNEEGVRLYERQNFHEAYDMFKEACEKCAQGYTGQSMFKRNRDNAANEVASILNEEGISLSSEGHHKEAYEKHKAACEIATKNSPHLNCYKSNKNVAYDKMKKLQKADKLERDGDALYSKQKHGEAYKKYSAALETWPSGYLKRKKDRSGNEFADDLNLQGDVQYANGNYEKALKLYEEALKMCTFDFRNRSIFAENKGMVEEHIARNNNAGSLLKEGDNLFKKGEYKAAFKKYTKAREVCTNNYKHISYLETKADQAQDCHLKNKSSVKLFNEGMSLYEKEEYAAAWAKLKEASETCTTDYSEKKKFKTKADDAKSKENANIEAERLGKEGMKLLRVGKYKEAAEILYRAHSMCSQNHKEKEAFKRNRDIARNHENTNNQARFLNQEGLNLYNEGYYQEAHDTFKEAFTRCITGFSEESFLDKILYKSNIDKAQAELDAIKLNRLGDNYVKELNYAEAIEKYRAASRVSEVPSQQKIFKNNLAEAELLNQIKQMWSEAFSAEDDYNDRTQEANTLFGKVLEESQKGLTVYPRQDGFKHYVAISSLKIEGNNIVNEGIELQDDGLTLLEQAFNSKQQQDVHSTLELFQKAKEKFVAAKEKFKVGRQTDIRFESSINFVDERIGEVNQSIKVIQLQVVSQDLNMLDMSANTTCDSCEADVANNNYQQVI